ncbi:MAG: hypothetical protein J7647_23120 [Cyanobacteria bacterium SBLK]|nr:hypothetical protein [Cyanobacteria bacterium SBLK]
MRSCKLLIGLVRSLSGFPSDRGVKRVEGGRAIAIINSTEYSGFDCALHFINVLYGDARSR